MIDNSNKATKILISLINDYGISVISDPIRFENLLRDYYRGENRKEASILIFSLKEGIADDLNKNNYTIPYEILSKSLINRLIEHGGYSEDNAIWAVDSWACALGIITKNETTLLQKTFHIASDPIGCSISIDGQYVGSTPYTYSTDRSGELQITCSKDGYLPKESVIHLNSFDSQSIFFSLIPDQTNKKKLNGSTLQSSHSNSNQPPAAILLTGRVSISTSPTGVDIKINDFFMGVSPLQIELPIGKHSIELSASGYNGKVIPFSLKPGQDKKILESLTPVSTSSSLPYGGLNLVTSPEGARALLNSKDIGVTPLTVKDLPSGEYSLKIVKAGYLENEGKITIPQYSIRNVRITLTLPASACNFCKKPLEPLNIFTCRYCGKKFCGEHRLPFSHACVNIDAWKNRGNPYQSSSTSKHTTKHKGGGLFPPDLKKTKNGTKNQSTQNFVEHFFSHHYILISLLGLLSLFYFIIIFIPGYELGLFASLLGVISVYLLYKRRPSGKKITFFWLGLLCISWFFAGGFWGYALAIGHLLLIPYISNYF